MGWHVYIGALFLANVSLSKEGGHWGIGMVVAKYWLLGLFAVLFMTPTHLFAQSCSAESIDRATIEAKGELMAPCCWKDTLANHSSPRSDELSAEVRRLAEECKSTDEILEIFASKHGDAILARPRTSGFGLWFYAGPGVLLLLTGLLLSKKWLPSLLAPADTGAAPSEGQIPMDDDDELDARFEAELKRLDH